MLFQQLYNWIKYKTLPPSVLFKNRLFIERDSKNRKIFNNFGLIFRNTRWSGYETYNISLNFRVPLYRFFFLFFFVIIFFFVITNFKYFYIYHWAFNFVAFLWWGCVDIFDYYLVFLVWFFITAISSFTNLIYFYFFFNKLRTDFFKNRPLFFKILKFESHKIPKFSKHDLNWLLYSWLINNTRNGNLVNFDALFDSYFKTKQWEKGCTFFVKLYKLVHLLNLSTSKNTTVFSMFNVNKIEKKTPNSFNIFIFKPFSFIFFYNLFADTNDKHDRSCFFLKNRLEWNPFYFNIELQKFNFLFKYKQGQFFFKNLNFGEFLYYLNNNQEFLTLSNNLRNQLNTAKWGRWLYRYSLLHRKLFKNSHKITLVKKLINFNPITETLYSKNLWAAEHFTKFENNNNFFNSLSNIFFNKFLRSETGPHFTGFNIFNLNKNDGGFKNFSHYENSFFWYLKRNYVLNALRSNNIKSALNLKTPMCVENTYHPTRLKHFFLLSTVSNSLFLNTLNFQIFSIFSENILLFKNFKNSIFNENFLIKDLSLILNNKNFLTREHLERVFWISTQISNPNHKLNFFDYFGLFDLGLNTRFSDFCNDSEKHELINYWTILTVLNYDGLFINDLGYLTFF